MELAYVSLLHAVPKAWRVTKTHTHTPRRRAFAWGCRAVLLLAAYFLEYYYFPNCKPTSNPSARFSPNQSPLFSLCKDTRFPNSLYLFFMILFKRFKAFAINNLSTLPFSIFPPHVSSLKSFKSIELDKTTRRIASKTELFYSKSSRIPFVQIELDHHENPQCYHKQLTMSELNIIYI
jgi:hypothetical protein